MKASTRIESVPPATPLSRMLAAIHAQQQSPGLNPKEAIHNLERLIAEQAWEHETDDVGRSLTFQRVLEEPWPVGVGLTEVRRKRIFELAEDAGVPPKNIARVRRRIDELLPPLLENGRPRKIDNIKVSGRRSGRGGTDKEYIRRRLAREAKKPDGEKAQELYDRLVAGDISADRAMQLWGKPRPYVQVRSDDAIRAMKKLREFYTLDELRAAMAGLT